MFMAAGWGVFAWMISGSFMFERTDAQSWMNLQTHDDTETIRELMQDTLSRIRRFEASA